jgi:CRISPR-associated endonuclease/helicase Cas3
MPFGLRTTEINNRREEHFGRLKRVTFDGLEQAAEPPEMAWSEVAVGLLKTECGLAVVNTRKAARDLFAAVQANTDAKDGVFHLSTWMFPEHRMQVLAEVRRRLDAGVPCRLVSTQCVEAGVDIDFPEVWRAYGPYDSIIQAAGRCNRNGRLASGVVHVFRPKDGKIPSGLYETATMQTDLLRRLGLALPDDPQSFPAYFRLLYQLSVPDDCEVQRERGQLHFEEVSRLFHLIEDHTVPVLVLGYMDGGSRRSTESEAVYAEAARRGFFLRDDWRVLQRHIVNLPRSSAARLTGIASRPDFAPEIELYVLNGDASYRGGLNGCGIDLGAAYEEAIVL